MEAEIWRSLCVAVGTTAAATAVAAQAKAIVPAKFLLPLKAWIVIGAGVAITGGAVAVWQPSPKPVPAAPVATPIETQPASVQPPAIVPPLALKAPVVKPRVVAAPKAQAHSTLREEGEALLAVRAALRAGDAALATQLLASFARKFPKTALQQERDALEVDALAAAHDDHASQKAEAFLRAYPDSPLREKMRAIAGVE
jgi:hypothetical protein